MTLFASNRVSITDISEVTKNSAYSHATMLFPILNIIIMTKGLSDLLARTHYKKKQILTGRKVHIMATDACKKSRKRLRFKQNAGKTKSELWSFAI